MDEKYIKFFHPGTNGKNSHRKSHLASNPLEKNEPTDNIYRKLSPLAKGK